MCSLLIFYFFVEFVFSVLPKPIFVYIFTIAISSCCVCLTKLRAFRLYPILLLPFVLIRDYFSPNLHVFSLHLLIFHGVQNFVGRGNYFPLCGVFFTQAKRRQPIATVSLFSRQMFKWGPFFSFTRSDRLKYETAYYFHGIESSSFFAYSKYKE